MAAANFGAWRYGARRDDIGASLVGLVTLIGLGTWTLAVWLGLSFGQALCLGSAICAVPLAAMIGAVRRAGAADPYDD